MSRSRRYKLPLTRSAVAAKVVEDANNPPLSPLSKKIKKGKDRVAQNIAFQELLAIRASNGGRAKHNDIQAVVDKYSNRGEFVKRHHIEYRMQIYNKGKGTMKTASSEPIPDIPADVPAPADIPADQTVVSPLTDDVALRSYDEETSKENEESNEESLGTGDIRKGGRKKGSTKKAKALYFKKVGDALTEASTRCHAEKMAAQSKQQKVACGTYKRIIQETELKYELPEGKINFETIKSRVNAGNVSGICHQKVSPILEVEPLIVDWCCRLSRMGESLTKYEVMDLADDIIRDTIHADRLNEFCEKRKIKKEDWGERILGERWYSNFMKRHSDKLKRGKCVIQAANRRTWCNKENFGMMYDAVYESMVDAGVAVKLPEKVMFDKEGKVTTNPEEMYGRPTAYQLTKPERCLFVDETGCNTNQCDGKHIGGRQYVTAVGQTEGARTGSTSDIHFTLLSFTAATGEVVMCAVILKSDKNVDELPMTWRLGIDVSKDVVTGKTAVETYDNNVETEATIGGPKCKFNGEDIPCFVTSSPNASITSEMLVEMMKAIDGFGVFPRSEEEGVPFLLIDGHHSRTRLPFLNYINDPLHLWKVCIGVPYATHLWQPHDSSELNGTFKIALAKAKSSYIKSKPPSMKSFVSTDIIPIINRAWPDTLGNKKFAQKSILERGWFVLNYILLDDPRLEASTSSTELSFSCETNLSTINTSGEMFISKLDILIDGRVKDDGRKRKFEETKLMMQSKTENIKSLEKTLGVSSGKLASLGVYGLNVAIRDKLLKEETEKKQKVNEIKIRQDKLIIKDGVKFRNAAQKYFKKKDLRISEMRALIKKVNNKKTDSAMKTKLGELKLQLKRRSGRLEAYNIFDDINNCDENVVETLNNESTNEKNNNQIAESDRHILVPAECNTVNIIPGMGSDALHALTPDGECDVYASVENYGV